MTRLREVAIADCVHFCGFRYGRDEFNPYENYVVGLARGTPLPELRSRFVDFVRHYRPRDLGAALGVATARPVPLWLLPWKSWRKLWRPGGWTESLDEVLDILTYFCERGVRWARIDEEFGWLERAWRWMRDDGYCPERHGAIEVFELVDRPGSTFVVVDGNHRLAALHAGGATRVRVAQRRLARAHRARVPWWPLVLSGHVTSDDARALFDAYRRGNKSPHRASVPAAILDEADRALTPAEIARRCESVSR